MLARRVTRSVAVALGVLLPLGLAGATPAGALSPDAADRVGATLPRAAEADEATATEALVARRLTARAAKDPRLGGSVVGVVVDSASGRVVWSKSAASGRIPASTTKIATAVAAVHVFGPSHRFATTVRLGAGSSSRVVLVAGGDPELRGHHLTQLAKQTASALQKRGRSAVSLRVDDSVFRVPRLAPGWKPSYYPHNVAPVRGLIVDQREVRDTALDAAHRFARLLRAQGVTVTSVARDRYAKVGGQLASVPGWTVASIVRRMLRVSDNDDAEYLARQVALAEGFRPQWDGGRAAVRQVLTERVGQLGTFDVYDGSGLSRTNRISPRALVALLDHVQRTPVLARVMYHSTGMPVSGVSGTLGPGSKRYATSPTKCAKGRIAAKTGSLSGVIALAGRTKDADGAVKTFAFLVSGEPADLTTRRAVDRLATTITGCW